MDVHCRPEILQISTSRISAEIEPQCSGLEGIMVIWIVLATYILVFRKQLRFPAAWLLFPVGTALIWVLNVVRIAGFVVIGDRISPTLVQNGFHSYRQVGSFSTR